MTKFYDAKDEADLSRVEAVLREGGIEFFIAAAPPNSGIANEITVAEEDVPRAEELLLGVKKGFSA